MKILVKEPNKKPYVTEIDNTLEGIQSIIDGFFEIIRIPNLPGLCCVCDDVGKLKDLPYNFTIYNDDIVGTVFFVNEEHADFVDINEGYVEILNTMFKELEED